MGSQPSPPTLDTAQSRALTQADYDLKIQNTPSMVRTVGQSGRNEYANNIAFALRAFANPASIFQGETKELYDKNTELYKQLASPAFDANVKRGIQKKIDANNAEITKLQQSDPVGDLTKAFSNEFGLRDNLLGDMRDAEKSTSEYQRMQRALGRGVTARQAGMERVKAQETGESALGRNLMSEAIKKVAQGGRLSQEASRDAVQAARSGMAARGMATGSSGMAAELLNRDSFARRRELENLGFAQSVEAADLARRTGNTANRQQAGMQNAQAFNQLSQFNTLQRSDTDRFNMGLLQTSAQASDAERARQLGLGQTAYNFALQTNPKMMLAGLGSPYANFTPQALGLMGNQNVQPIYSGGSFSSGGTGSMIAGGLGGAMSGAAAGSALGPWGAGIGGVVGLGAGLLSSRS